MCVLILYIYYTHADTHTDTNDTLDRHVIRRMYVRKRREGSPLEVLCCVRDVCACVCLSVCVSGVVCGVRVVLKIVNGSVGSERHGGKNSKLLLLLLLLLLLHIIFNVRERRRFGIFQMYTYRVFYLMYICIGTAL